MPPIISKRTRYGTDEPWFVAAKELARNALVAVQGHDHPLLYRMEVDAINLHWIGGASPAFPARFGAKTRYRMPDATCCLVEGAEGLAATFDVPQWAPTPGQYLVLYDGDVCLGGGVIASPGSAVRRDGARKSSTGTANAAAVAASINQQMRTTSSCIGSDRRNRRGLFKDSIRVIGNLQRLGF